MNKNGISMINLDMLFEILKVFISILNKFILIPNFENLMAINSE